MSHHPSACVPPPSSYAPRPRNPNHSHDRGRGARGNRGHYRGRGGGGTHGKSQSNSISFQRDQETNLEETTKIQPKDRFHRNEDDDYFASINDETDEANEKIADKSSEEAEKVDNLEDCDEDDPLDAYMKSLEKPKETTNAKSSNESKSLENSDEDDTSKLEVSTANSTSAAPTFDKKGVRLDIDSGEDLEESYIKYVEQSKRKQSSLSIDDCDLAAEQQDLIEYDNFGNLIGLKKVKREVEPLPIVDHSTIDYLSFEKKFYQEHEEIQKLTPEQGDELRSKLEIKIFGRDPQKPVCSFAHFKFDEQLMKVIRRSEYTQPTPIQAQAIPVILSGRNVIGIAMTGSGKTAAYLWPMIVHINNQPRLSHGDGPVGLILVPTRELALQVYSEAKKFSQTYRMRVVCAYGGGSKYLQSEDLKSGAEIVVATPGRLIDLVKLNATNLRRVTYLVLDEADRFFDMGFEAQVRSICSSIRPDRQTLLFSATFKRKIEQLALSVTEDPIKIVQKSLGEANEDVTQHVIISREGTEKWSWLNSKLIEFTSSGSVLIFVTRIANCEELHNNLKQQGKETLLLHGDMEQSERNRVITAFRRKERDIMIATDVAARGLDISHIKTVINYDVARDIDTHTHRIGRTGRAGTKGDAYTLLTEKDKDFAGYLVKNLESSSQKVNEDLLKLAMQSHSFRKSSSHHKHYNKHQGGGNHDHRHQNHHHHQDKQQSYHHHDSNPHSRTYQSGGNHNSSDRSNRPSSSDYYRRQSGDEQVSRYQHVSRTGSYRLPPPKKPHWH